MVSRLQPYQLIVSGVPQGSVLGPLLFVIYKVPEITLSDGCMTLYADDILLYRRIRTQSDYSLLQQDVNKLQTWFSQNHLELNISKCKYMVISKKRHPLQPTIQLNISCQPLECVSKYKYLGIWLTNNLSRSTHIGRVTKHAAKNNLQEIYAHSHPDTLKQLYLTLSGHMWSTPHKCGILITQHILTLLKRFKSLPCICALKHGGNLMTPTRQNTALPMAAPALPSP